jgi:hypothetical protein
MIINKCSLRSDGLGSFHHHYLPSSSINWQYAILTVIISICQNLAWKKCRLFPFIFNRQTNRVGPCCTYASVDELGWLELHIWHSDPSGEPTSVWNIRWNCGRVRLENVYWDCWNSEFLECQNCQILSHPKIHVPNFDIKIDLTSPHSYTTIICYFLELKNVSEIPFGCPGRNLSVVISQKFGPKLWYISELRTRVVSHLPNMIMEHLYAYVLSRPYAYLPT